MANTILSLPIATAAISVTFFPPPGEDGIRKRDFGLTPIDFAWSPDARHIAVIYLGDLWLVDVVSVAAQQLTFDGGSSNPVWTR